MGRLLFKWWFLKSKEGFRLRGNCILLWGNSSSMQFDCKSWFPLTHPGFLLVWETMKCQTIGFFLVYPSGGGGHSAGSPAPVAHSTRHWRRFSPKSDERLLRWKESRNPTSSSKEHICLQGKQHSEALGPPPSPLPALIFSMTLVFQLETFLFLCLTCTWVSAPQGRHVWGQWSVPHAQHLAYPTDTYWLGGKDILYLSMTLLHLPLSPHSPFSRGDAFKFLFQVLHFAPG